MNNILILPGEEYLQPSWISTMEVFLQQSLTHLAVNYFHQKNFKKKNQSI